MCRNCISRSLRPKAEVLSGEQSESIEGQLKPEQEMKNTTKKLLPLILIFLFIGGVLFVKLKQDIVKFGTPNETNYATLKIEDNETHDISDYVGKTALEATQGKVEVITKGEGENAFVISVDGKQADTNQKEFWEFKVNGQQAQIGAGSYIIKNHDQIEWKITNF